MKNCYDDEEEDAEAVDMRNALKTFDRKFINDTNYNSSSTDSQEMQSSNDEGRHEAGGGVQQQQ